MGVVPVGSRGRTRQARDIRLRANPWQAVRWYSSTTRTAGALDPCCNVMQVSKRLAGALA